MNALNRAEALANTTTPFFELAGSRMLVQMTGWCVNDHREMLVRVSDGRSQSGWFRIEVLRPINHVAADVATYGRILAHDLLWRQGMGWPYKRRPEGSN